MTRITTVFAKDFELDRKINSELKSIENRGNRIIKIIFPNAINRSLDSNLTKAVIVYEANDDFNNAEENKSTSALIQNIEKDLNIKVGDRLYGFFTDEYLDKESDSVEIYDIEKIEITKVWHSRGLGFKPIYETDILFCSDSFDGVICNLESLLYNKPYSDKRIFRDEKAAKAELAAARKRKGYI